MATDHLGVPQRFDRVKRLQQRSERHRAHPDFQALAVAMRFLRFRRQHLVRASPGARCVAPASSGVPLSFSRTAVAGAARAASSSARAALFPLVRQGAACICVAEIGASAGTCTGEPPPV